MKVALVIVVRSGLEDIAHLEAVLLGDFPFRADAHAFFVEAKAFAEVVTQFKGGVGSERRVFDVVFDLQSGAQVVFVLGLFFFHIGSFEFGEDTSFHAVFFAGPSVNHVSGNLVTIFVTECGRAAIVSELVAFTQTEGEASGGDFSRKVEDGTVFVAPVAVVHVQSVGDDSGGVILVGFPILFRLLEITLVDEVIAHSERKELEGFIGRTEGEVPALHASQFVLGSEVKSGLHGELFGEILLGAERRP